ASIILCWAVARRLWPERPSLALMAAALLGTSSQLIVTGMTAYAMPAHLALNLAWLWLFLRGGRLGHAGALIVGFFTCGIHQVVFHPVFAAPFILQLWLDRRWALAALYTAAYGAFGLFWIEYYPIALAVSGVTAAAAKGTGGAWLGVRIAAFLAKISFSNL